MLYRIFSYSHYIYKILSTKEKLFQCEIDHATNKVVKEVVYKRVRNGDPEIDFLLRISHKKVPGEPTPFKGVEYDVYALVFDKTIRGYMLYAKSSNENGQQAERMYFV